MTGKSCVIVALYLLTLPCFVASCYAWSNGGYSSDPLNPNYGTHDWIAEHALDWLTSDVKQWITSEMSWYLYGTELPDNGRAPDGIGDTALHHIYFNSSGCLIDDSAAVRANATYQQALDLLLLGNLQAAAKYAGAMTHYISDMAVFSHVMGSKTPWGSEIHHSDYEEYVNERTSSYSSIFNEYLSFDGKLSIITAYEAAVRLAYDATFDISGRGLTCVWMDQNYNWSNPTFVGRTGELLNSAVNYVADVLYTLYIEYQSHQQAPTTATVTFTAEGLSADASGTVLIVDGEAYAYSQLPASFTWDIGSIHSFAWSNIVSSTMDGKRYAWDSTSGLSTSKSGMINVPSGGGSVTATYKIQYALVISVNPSGAGTTNPQPGAYWHDSDSSASVSVSPNTGYTFSYWTLDGEDAGSSITISITMNAPHNLTATFTVAMYTLTVHVYRSETNIGISGVTVKVDGATYTTSSEGSINITVFYGSHMIEVSSPYIPSSGTRYVFTSWSDNLTSNPRTASVSSDVTLTAYMKIQYLLTVSINPSGTGNVSLSLPGQDGYYDSDVSVTLMASPALGYRFINWSGSVNSTENPLVVKVEGAPVFLQANFEESFDFGVSVSISGITIPAGESLTVMVEVSLITGKPEDVALSASSLPPESTFAFSQTSGTPPFTSNLKIKTSKNTPAGTYQITITGTSGSQTRTAYVTLKITNLESPLSALFTPPLAFIIVAAAVLAAIIIVIIIKRR